MTFTRVDIDRLRDESERIAHRLEFDSTMLEVRSDLIQSVQDRLVQFGLDDLDDDETVPELVVH